MPYTKRCEHCIIWTVAMNGSVVRRCAHCTTIVGSHEEPNAELAARQAKQSQTSHDDICPRAKIRSSVRANAQVTRVTSSPATDAQRRARMRTRG